MKKLVLLILTVALALGSFVSCDVANVGHTDGNGTGGGNGTGDGAQELVSATPADEEGATHTVTSTSEDGIEIEVTVHGYKSESQKKDFYVKSNEYFLVDVKITNRSDASVYKRTSCMESDPAHNHEIDVDLSYGEYKLNTSHFGFECTAKVDVLEIKAGESRSWQLKLAAGERSTDKFDLPADGEGGILLYGREVYQSGSGDGLHFEVGGKDEDKKGEDQKGESQEDKGGKSDETLATKYYETHYYAPGGSLGTGNISFSTGGGFVINGSLGENITIIAIASSCVYDGTLSFSYATDADSESTLCVSAPLSVEVKYIPTETNQNGDKK